MLDQPSLATSVDVGTIAAAVAAGLTALVALLTFARSVRSIRLGGVSGELHSVEVELNRLTESAPREPEAAPGSTPRRISEVDRRSLALFEQYHTQGLAQSRQSFTFSLVFASLGFLIVCGAVVNAVIQDSGVSGANAVSLLSAAIIEAVSTSFFVQSHRARVLMEAFFDRLRTDRALDEALRLADEVTDPLVQSRLKTALAFSLAERKVSDGLMRSIMGADPPHSEPAPKHAEEHEST